MKRLSVAGASGTSTIMVGERFENLPKHSVAGKIAIITDSTVKSMYGQAFPTAEVIEIGQGEGVKTLATVEGIYRRFLAMELDRSSFVLGIGGGIVCDVTGFAASTYLRGLGFGLVPTTLLAQADAAIGGKNGVNLDSYKNMVGTFRQPEFCLIDFSFLRTLPDAELRNGFAEIIKHGAIANSKLFKYLQVNSEALLNRDSFAMEKTVYESVKTKLNIAARDERESGERMKLNFGHTIGHAIEKTLKVSHGEAVSIGMCLAARLSVSRGLLKEKDMQQLVSLVGSFGLPAHASFDANAVFDAIRKDKKRRGDEVNMVLLDGIGKAVVQKVGLAEIRATLASLGGHDGARGKT